MQSARELLEEMAKNKKGILTLRKEVMGAAGEVHRHCAKVVDELVREGLATWVNSPRRTIARITSAGRGSLKE